VAALLSSHLTPVRADVVEYDLTVAEQEVNLTGRPVRAVTLNGAIPGPVLRFTEGDTARIRVHNRLDADTSVHWHGLLVPPGMDGVPFLSFPPIAPGSTFTYEFPVRQAGTYWYHSHSDLQEQRGLYGSIVIEPRRDRARPDRDHVVLFSDWTDEPPGSVLRTLKRGSEWYALEKGSGQSLLGAARLGALGAYLGRELARMPPMDISDVAYDRFLANGTPETSLEAGAGDRVRLRLVAGSSTTYFHLGFAGGPMTIVAADGQDVEPVELERLLIAAAETYDVLVTVPGDGAYELRATAHDGSASASVWLGTGRRHHAPGVPRPDVYRGHAMGGATLGTVFALTPAGAVGMPDRQVAAGLFDRPGMAGMEHHGMHPAPEGMHRHQGTSDEAGLGSARGKPPRDGRRFGRDFGLLGADAASAPELAVDGTDPRRPWPPYGALRAVEPTSFSPERAVREVRLTLDGDMERYVWFLGGRPLSESDAIRIRGGEVVRLILINRTMMHHPMHLHGHFFRVVNGQGDRAPWKHTVDVAPMSTTVIEFAADEPGDWFFHCHLLYHMMSGMARVVHYEGFEPAPETAGIRSGLAHDPWHAFGSAEVLSNRTEGFLQVSNTRNLLTGEWEVGWQGVEDVEWEGIATWGRYVNRFFTAFAGGDFRGADRNSDDARAILGFRYLLPMSVESRVWVDSDLGGRVSTEKHLDLTPRLGLAGEVEYDTHDHWEGSVGLSYLVNRAFSVVGRWHSEFGFGVGAEVRF
jgi:CopA family copper-resistance protein